MLIKCENVTIGYENKVICDNINLEIDQADYVTIFGLNGSGKSTFLKTLVGLIPVLKGKVIFDSSVDIKSIGYLPQSVNVKSDFPASAFEIVLSGMIKKLKGRPFYNKKEKEHVREVMKLFNILRLANRPFRELSGGQQQRVLLARAFCAMDKILVLDEPFNGLDKYSVQQLIETLNHINKENGVTIIIVSHMINEALLNSKKIINIDENGIFCGTPEEFIERGKVENVTINNR